MANFSITITGTRPLLMHNSRLANPLDPAAKALKAANSKRKKTDDDHLEIARLEHAGSLYTEPNIGPYIPGENITSALVDGAKISRQGVSVKRGVLITTDFNPLSYDGPRDVDGLWKDENFRHSATVKVSTSRVVRTRPVFREWAVQADGFLDTSILEVRDLQRIAETAGQLVGLGDWRPRYGRFEAVVEVTE